MLRVLILLARTPRFFQEFVVEVIARLARFPLGDRIVSARETHVLARTLERTTTPGPTGGALGCLFRSHEPGQSAKDIYKDIFSSKRFERGYLSQMGQDLFLNRWFFKDHGHGFFVDVGAFDGELGSNTSFFERQLHWAGLAFEPNASAFEVLRANRSCRLIEGCAYDRDGEVSFLALWEKDQQRRVDKARPPRNLLSMMIDPIHGGAMLSGIPEHMDQHQRVEWARDALNLDQSLLTVPCHRIDTVLNETGVNVVDYLSIDVEGAELEVLHGIDFERVQGGTQPSVH